MFTGFNIFNVNEVSLLFDTSTTEVVLNATLMSFHQFSMCLPCLTYLTCMTTTTATTTTTNNNNNNNNNNNS